MDKSESSIGIDLYTEYPALEKEIKRMLKCIVLYPDTMDNWGDIEEAIADLIEKAKK